jgi:hypothetical protein
MQFGSINILVNNPDEAMKTYVKMFGTNNIEQVIKLKGLNDSVDIVDGYYLKTHPIHLGLFKPRTSSGRMGAALAQYGEGIHHIEIHMPQEDFENTFLRFRYEGYAVSEKITYIGKFSEAIFWLEETGTQGLPIKFCTKTTRSMRLWRDTIYLDTPQRYETVSFDEEIIRPAIAVKSIMVTVSDFETKPVFWSEMLSRPWVEAGDIYKRTHGKVDDKRGNIFIPIRYQFSEGGGINMYCTVNEDAPINKEMALRGRNAMYHNAAGYIVRDGLHECWKQWEAAGFNMVDPKPLLNANTGNGNYFFFLHPSSTNGVLWEYVSMTSRDAAGEGVMDWNNVKTYMVSPEVS